jgi:hypothetical protein
MEKNMSGIQPHTLTDDELTRLIYMQLGQPVPSMWVAELLTRFYQLQDMIDPAEEAAQ